LSYALLDAETLKRWRRLGVFPDSFDTPAAAAVWEVETDAAEDILGRQLQYSMLDWNDADRRYRLHDLMREFARGRMSGYELAQGARRHARHYIHVLARAEYLYNESVAEGLALFDLERSNIQAGQAWAADLWQHDDEAARLCCQYPGAAVYCLVRGLEAEDYIRWQKLGLASARHLGDRRAEGLHLDTLGWTYTVLSLADSPDRGLHASRAIEYYKRRLAVAREIADRDGEGHALGNLGDAYHRLREYSRAIEYHEPRLAIDREIGDRRGEGTALDNLGSAYGGLGEYRRAIEYYEQSLAIAREIGDRQGEGNALWNTSLALGEVGERQKAIQNAETALRIYEQIEDPYAEKVRKQIEEWKKAEVGG
jgi:tetratricopeptide (TPR) repeat protein